MASDRSRGELQIGEVLKEARGRARLEIGAVEERTKIRTRYLRALENEQWDVLPGHAYTKGFLRTYASLLGLDAEALLDEYRRQVEHARLGQPGPVEPWAPARRGEDPAMLGPRGPRPGLVLAGVAGVVLAILLVLGLTGGEDEAPVETEELTEAPRATRAPSSAKRRTTTREKPPGMPLKLVARIELPVCLLDQRDKPLLDKTMSAGEAKSFDARSYELRFPGGFDPGQIEVSSGGRNVRLIDFFGPVRYRIDEDGQASRPRQLPAGSGCP